MDLRLIVFLALNAALALKRVDLADSAVFCRLLDHYLLALLLFALYLVDLVVVNELSRLGELLATNLEIRDAGLVDPRWPVHEQLGDDLCHHVIVRCSDYPRLLLSFFISIAPLLILVLLAAGPINLDQSLPLLEKIVDPVDLGDALRLLAYLGALELCRRQYKAVLSFVEEPLQQLLRVVEAVRVVEVFLAFQQAGLVNALLETLRFLHYLVVGKETRQVVLQGAYRVLLGARQDLTKLWLGDGVEAKLALDCGLQLSIGLILDHLRLLLNQACDAALDLRRVLRVHCVAKVHRQTKQHLTVEALAMQLFELASLLQLLQELIALFLEFVFNFRRGPLQVLDVRQLFFIVYWPDKRVALPHFEETRDHLSDVVLLEGVGGDGLEHRLQALFHVVVRRLVLLRNVVVEIAKAPEEVRPCELLLLSRIASTSLRDLCLMLGI